MNYKKTRLIYLLITIVFLISCKESEQDRIARLVNVWIGKTIQYPNNMYLTSYTNDSVVTQFAKKQSKYTILSYVDTIGCTSCRLHLPRWKELIGYLDSVYPNKVNCLMVFYPKDKKRMIKYLRNDKFEHYVCIDEMDSLNKINNFLHEEHFCTFLLNEDNRIIAIGNPVLNPQIRDIYLNIISGKVVEPQFVNRPLTVVSLLEDKKDLGRFSWHEEKETEFVLSNAGKSPLIISDMITSCGCIIVEYSKKPVQAGEDLILKIKYKADHPEYFDKTITIYCNAENSPLRLRITGNAK